MLGRLAPTSSGPVVNAPAGTMASLADLHGKYVLLNFFASWCVPRQQEQADLSAFNQRHVTAGDAAVFGVVYDDQLDAVRSYLSSHNGDWPVIDSSGAKVDWGVRGVP